MESTRRTLGQRPVIPLILYISKSNVFHRIGCRKSRHKDRLVVPFLRDIHGCTCTGARSLPLLGKDTSCTRTILKYRFSLDRTKTTYIGSINRRKLHNKTMSTHHTPLSCTLPCNNLYFGSREGLTLVKRFLPWSPKSRVVAALARCDWGRDDGRSLIRHFPRHRWHPLP